MTTVDRFEESLPGLLDELARTDPSALIADVRMATVGSRQRPRLFAGLSSVLDRRDLRLVTGPIPPLLRVGLALALLLVAIAAAAVIAGALRSVSPRPAELVSAGTIPGSLSSPTVVALADGRLVIVGDSGDAAIVRIFDPASGTVAEMDTGLRSVSLLNAVTLGNGHVFLLGWQNADPVTDGRSVAWVLDPVTGRLTPPVLTLQPRFEPSVVALADGTALVSGGVANPESTTTYATSERFDPRTNRFEEGPSVGSGRYGHEAIALPGGDVLFAGGSGVTSVVQDPGSAASAVSLPIGTIERLDPATGLTHAVGTLPDRGQGGPIEIVVLPDRRVLIIPSQSSSRYCGRHEFDPVTPFLFDPATDTLTTAAPVPHSVRAAVAIPDGRVVVAGTWAAIPGGCGAGGEYVEDSWVGIYDPMTGETIESHNPITGGGTLPIDVNLPIVAGALLPDGRVALLTEDAVNGTPDAVDLLTVAPR